MAASALTNSSRRGRSRSDFRPNCSRKRVVVPQSVGRPGTSRCPRGATSPCSSSDSRVVWDRLAPRISSISARVTGWCQAITAKASIAARGRRFGTSTTRVRAGASSGAVRSAKPPATSVNVTPRPSSRIASSASTASAAWPSGSTCCSRLGARGRSVRREGPRRCGSPPRDDGRRLDRVGNHQGVPPLLLRRHAHPADPPRPPPGAAGWGRRPGPGAVPARRRAPSPSPRSACWQGPRGAPRGRAPHPPA